MRNGELVFSSPYVNPTTLIETRRILTQQNINRPEPEIFDPFFYLAALQPFLANSEPNIVFGHVTEIGKNKHAAFVEAVTPKGTDTQKEQQVVNEVLHFAPKFDEDKHKQVFIETPGIAEKMEYQLFISMCKADRYLSHNRFERSQQINDELRGCMSKEGTADALSRSSLVIEAGNDIMVYIETQSGVIIPMFKPDIPEGLSESEKRDAAFHYLVEFFAQLPEHFYVHAKSANSALEVKSNVGVIGKTTYKNLARKPTIEMISTLIYGVTEHTPTKLARMFGIAMESNHSHIPNFWSSKHGITNIDHALKVNGAQKHDHILWVLTSMYDDAGNPVDNEHFNEKYFKDKISFYQQLVRGFPHDLYNSVISLTEAIANIYYGQGIKNKSWKSFARGRKDQLRHLYSQGIRPTGTWLELPEVNYDQMKQTTAPLQVEAEIARLQELIRTYSRIAKPTLV